MTGLRALMRLARRDARRDRWRTVLVVALVAVPVAGMGGAITLFDTVTPTPQERILDGLGHADAMAFPDALDPAVDPLADLAGRLPEGTALEARRDGNDAIVVDGVRTVLALSDEPLGDDALGARYRLEAGRAPTTAAEIAPAEALARELGLAIGDVVGFDDRGEVTVVGIVRRPEFLPDRRVLVAPDTIDEVVGFDVLIGLPTGTEAGPETFAAFDEQFGDGRAAWYVTDRQTELGYRLSGGERWVAIVIGGLAAVEVALIAGAAFAVSVRRRQRELGLLAAVGGTQRHVRRVVLLTGITVGVVGALIGLALSVVGLLAVSPWLDQVANREIAGLRIDPLWLAGVALLGIGSAMLGAWWPARSVAALPVTVALSGRRPSPQPSVRGLRAGVLIMVGGAGVTAFGATLAQDPFVFLFGSVLLVLGTGLTSPWLLEQVGRLASRLPTGPRLALRDAARFRTRNGPIVTAAMAGLAASISVATVIGSMDASESAAHQPRLAADQLMVWGEGDAAARAVAGATGGTLAMVGATSVEARPVSTDADTNTGADTNTDTDADADVRRGRPVAVGSVELAQALGGDAAEEALAAGRVVVLGTEVDRIELWTWEEQQVGGQVVERSLGVFDAIGLPMPDGIDPMHAMFPTALMPVALTDEIELFDSAGLVTLPEPIDDGTYASAMDALAAVPGGSVDGAWIEVERGYRSPFAVMLRLALAVGATAGLLVVGVALALASAEARADLHTLTAVGASRRTRRTLAAGRALLLAGMGGVLAVPVGLVPGLAILSQVGDVSFAVPWVAIGIAVVLVPGLATAGAVLASRRSPGTSLRAAV